ncbi:hypothetical protein Tco_1393455 [Tanacetum coccineum]
MANQEQNPPQQEQPFVAAKQVGFNLEDIILNINNEVALFYPKHNNKDYFKCVSDFISKCCLRKPFTKSPNMYKEYLAEFWYSAKALENSKVSFSIPTGGIFREVGINTFRNAIGAHYLPHSSEYVAPSSIDDVRQWFPTIGYEEEVSAKGTLRKSLIPPRWRLLMAQIIQCLGGKTEGFDQITNKDVIILYSLANGINIDYANIFWEDIIIKLKKKQMEKVVPYTRFLSLLTMHKMKEGFRDDEVTLYPTQVFNKPIAFKAPKPSSNVERVLQGTKPGAKPGHKKHSFSKQPFCLATSGPTSLGVTSEARANPQLSSRNDASAASTTKADLRNSAPSTDPHVLVEQTKSVSEWLETVLTQPIIGKGASLVASQFEEETSSIIKLEDLAKVVSHVQPSFKDLDSPEDDPVIFVNDSDEDEDDEVHATKNSQKYKLELEKNKAEAALLKAQPSFPNVEQLKELLVKSLKTKFSNIIYAYDFSSSLPTKLKDLPSKFNDLTEEVKGLKNQVHNLEIELPGELKEFPPNLEDFTKTVTSLTSQVAELKTLQWELPAEFLVVPSQVEMAITSKKTRGDSVPSAGQASTQPAKEEKNTNQAIIS